MDFQKEMDRAMGAITKNVNKAQKDIQKEINKSTKRFQVGLFKEIERKRLNTNQTKKLKEIIGFKCESCGKKMQKSHYLEHHHIKPMKEKGKTTMGNIIILCLNCHADVTYDPKKNKKSYRPELRKKVKKRNERISTNKKNLEKIKSIYTKKKKTSTSSIIDQYLFG